MKKIIDKFIQFSDAFVALLLFSLFGTFLLQVFMRYIVSRPLSWTIEACIIAYVWIVFWGSSFILRFDEQVTFSVLYNSVSAKTQRIFTLISYFIIAAIFLYSAPYIIDYIMFMSLEKSDALHIRKDILYSVFGIFIVVTALRSCFVIYQTLKSKKQGENK